MRHILLVFFTLFTMVEMPKAQQLKDLLLEKKQDSTQNKQDGKNWLKQVGALTGGQPNTTEVVNGLKEALSIGTARSTEKLAAVDGFFGNAAIKILLPPEAKMPKKLCGHWVWAHW